jgi:hypothetical protein
MRLIRVLALEKSGVVRTVIVVHFEALLIVAVDIGVPPYALKDRVGAIRLATACHSLPSKLSKQQPNVGIGFVKSQEVFFKNAAITRL